MTDEVETTDQAPEQSVQDRIAAKFGLPTRSEQEAAAAPDSPTDDLFEIDWNGEKFNVPAKLKDSFMKSQDYTQKTQKLAEERAVLDHGRELMTTAQLKSAFEESVTAEREHLSVIDAYLKQAKALDWASMSTDQMVRQGRELDNVKEQRSALLETIQSKKAKFDEDVGARMKELRGKARELASKRIQGFTEQTEKDVREFAIGKGFSAQEFENIALHPLSLEALHGWLQFTKIQSNTTKAVATADKVVKPGASSERPLKGAAEQSRFEKAMREAPNSAKKAEIIAQRLENRFALKGH